WTNRNSGGPAPSMSKDSWMPSRASFMGHLIDCPVHSSRKFTARIRAADSRAAARQISYDGAGNGIAGSYILTSQTASPMGNLGMCNAYNHSFSGDCGFGGDTGGGGGGWRRRISYVVTLDPVSAGWAKDSRGTVESYINPNAHCPVCGKPVYFYR